jgi:hypothetical protein
MADKNKLFSFRAGEKLLEKLDQVKTSLGLSPSDTAREAMEEGLDRLLQKKTREQDRLELSNLERNRKEGLIYLLRKEKEGIELSRAEWSFLAQLANECYDAHYHSIQIIDRELLIANMLAFAEVIKLRNSQYPQLEKSDEDRYYFGNMGFSWVDREERANDLITHVRLAIKGLPEIPSIGTAVFTSRNFDVALRDEPTLDIRRLNTLLRPYLKSLLLISLRGYWDKNKKAVIDDEEFSKLKWLQGDSRHGSLYDVAPIANDHFSLSINISDTAISIGIEAKNHPFVFALNNFVEITGFISLLARVTEQKKHGYIPGIAVSPVSSYSNQTMVQYMLADGRWRIFFEELEIEAMKELLYEFTNNSTVREHLGRLEMIYGRV